MSRANVIRLFVLATLWGSGFLWVTVALQGFTPVQVVFSRLTLAAIVLAPMALARRLPFPKGWQTWGHLAVAAVLANAFPYTLVALAVQSVDSNIVGALNATTPLWTVLLVYIITSEPPGPRRAVGLAVGFAGTVLIFAPWQSANEIAGIGGLQGLAAAASYGMGYVYMARYLAGRGVPPLMLSFCQLAIATVLVALALPLPGSGGLVPPVLRFEAVAGLVVLGTISTGFAYVLNYRLITDAGPTAASTVTYLLPVVAVLLGWGLLDETVTRTILSGLALVLTGVALAQGRVRSRAAVPAPGVAPGPTPQPAWGLWLGALLVGATSANRAVQATRRALHLAAVRRQHESALLEVTGTSPRRRPVVPAEPRRLVEPARRPPQRFTTSPRGSGRQFGVAGATLLVGLLVVGRWFRSRGPR